MEELDRMERVGLGQANRVAIRETGLGGEKKMVSRDSGGEGWGQLTVFLCRCWRVYVEG